VSGQLHAPAALPSLHPFYRRLGGPQSRSGHLEKRKFLALPGLELRSLGRPVHSQSLYRLRYPGSSNRLGYYRIGLLWKLQEIGAELLIFLSSGI
jgi:hypothetical protein